MWRYRVDVVPNLPKYPVPVSMLYRYGYQPRYRRPCRYRRYRYPCRTEVTELSGTGIDVVPKLPKRPVPVLMLYRTYRSVRYRCWCCTELTEMSGIGMDVVPNLSKCPVPVRKSLAVPAVPVLMSYRTYRSVRHRYWCTAVAEVSGTGIDVQNLLKYPVPVCLGTYRTQHTLGYSFCWDTGK